MHSLGQILQTKLESAQSLVPPTSNHLSTNPLSSSSNLPSVPQKLNHLLTLRVFQLAPYTAVAEKKAHVSVTSFEDQISVLHKTYCIERWMEHFKENDS